MNTIDQIIEILEDYAENKDDLSSRKCAEEIYRIVILEARLFQLLAVKEELLVMKGGLKR